MTLYKTLGIKNNATKSEIKRAYRKKAIETHPDKGGSVKEFSEVSRAYFILFDENRRLIYDTTGSYEEKSINQIVSQAIDIISQQFLNLLQQGESVLYKNLFEEIKNAVILWKRNQNQEIKKKEKNILFLQKIKSKIKYNKNNDTDFIAIGLETHIKQERNGILTAKNNIEIADTALLLLEDYSFNFEKREDGGMQWIPLTHFKEVFPRE